MPRNRINLGRVMTRDWKFLRRSGLFYFWSAASGRRRGIEFVGGCQRRSASRAIIAFGRKLGCRRSQDVGRTSHRGEAVKFQRLAAPTTRTRRHCLPRSVANSGDGRRSGGTPSTLSGDLAAKMCEISHNSVKNFIERPHCVSRRYWALNYSCCRNRD